MNGAGRYRIQRGVHTPSRVAAILISSGGLGDFARRVRGQDPEVDEVLADMLAEALAWSRAARARHGVDPAPPTGAPSGHSEMSTREAAEALDCSIRTVQRHIETGRLPATFTRDRWVLAPEDVEHHRAARAANR